MALDVKVTIKLSGVAGRVGFGVPLILIPKAASNIDPDVQGDIFTSLKKLAGAGKDVLWNEAKKAFEHFDPAKAIAEE